MWRGRVFYINGAWEILSVGVHWKEKKTQQRTLAENSCANRQVQDRMDEPGTVRSKAPDGGKITPGMINLFRNIHPQRGQESVIKNTKQNKNAGLAWRRRMSVRPNVG